MLFSSLNFFISSVIAIYNSSTILFSISFIFDKKVDLMYYSPFCLNTYGYSDYIDWVGMKYVDSFKQLVILRISSKQ
jgi:hypothetical protein